MSGNEVLNEIPSRNVQPLTINSDQFYGDPQYRAQARNEQLNVPQGSFNLPPVTLMDQLNSMIYTQPDAVAPPSLPRAQIIQTHPATENTQHTLAAAPSQPDTAQAGKDEHHVSFWTNPLINVTIATAAIFGAEALCAVVFKNPKLAFGAIEALETTAKLSPLATRIVIGAGIYGTAMTGAVAARHYAYQSITGNKETWLQSANETGIGVFSVTVGTKLTDKIMPFLVK